MLGRERRAGRIPLLRLLRGPVEDIEYTVANLRRKGFIEN